MLKTNIKNDIQDIMNEMNVTQYALASRMGVSRQRIHDIVTKERTYVPKCIVDVADLLGFDVEVTFVEKE